MNATDFSTVSSAADFGIASPSKQGSNPGIWGSKIQSGAFQIASYLTDPICKAHEFFRRVAVVDTLNPTSRKIENLGRKVLLVSGLIGYALLAMVATVPGVAIRALAANLQKEPFLYSKGESPQKTLPGDRTFSLLSWNICCVGAGYSISDGGVVPWSFRIDEIVKKIIEKDADVNCIYETFDSHSGFAICEKLKQNGYANVYFNIGPQALGTSSGILVASKYAIKNPEFTLFPKETLVGRTKLAAKGVFSFDLESKGSRFATIHCTHLQHSEEPEFPTSEEAAARRMQMQLILEKIEKVKGRCAIVTGDLNLDDEEYRASFWQHRFVKGDAFGSERTWGGDAFCAKLVGKRVSGPLNLDHTMLLKGTARSIHTSLVETGYDPERYKKGALSDHEGLFSRVSL
jgi:hypothetical protein